jgi:predicted GIY-YIG superfamily endonuclease
VCTYKATNTLNGKFYIGSTRDFEARKKGHLSSRHNYPFQNALRKNPEAFVWEVWSDDSDEPILEQALLDMWYGKEQCYNLNPIANRPPNNPDICSKGGTAVHNLKKGIHSLEWLESDECREQRRKNGVKVREERKGMFSLTPEEMFEVRSLTGSSNHSRKVGLFDPDYVNSDKKKEDSHKGGVTQGFKHLKEQTGLFKPDYIDSEKRTEDCKKGGSVSGSQVWESTHDGYRNNAGNVAQHNRRNGWDPNNRIKVS